jgi:hypothetical protein
MIQDSADDAYANTNSAIDVYAQTNSAFASLVLHRFVAEFSSSPCGSDEKKICIYPLLFLPLALTFAKERRATFDHTNKTTGFFDWVERSPEVRVGLGEEIRASVPHTKCAATFALGHGLLRSDAWHFWSNAKTGWRTPPWRAKADERRRILVCSRLLGVWCSRIEPRALFQTLGILP